MLRSGPGQSRRSRHHARAREIADATTDRVFLRLGPNGTLGAQEHQWILCRSGNAVSFVHSILARCFRERGIEMSPEGRAAMGALAGDFSTWRANPTWRGTPLSIRDQISWPAISAFPTARMFH